MGLILRNMSASNGSQTIGVTGSFFLMSASNGSNGGYLSLPQTTGPAAATPGNARGFLYVASSSTTPANSSLWFKSDSGTESDLIGGGAVDGTGKADRGTYWSDSNTVTYSDNWTFNSLGAWNLDATTYEVDASSTIVLDSDSSVTIGGASLDIDADGGAIAIDATTTIGIGTNTAAGNITIGSNATARTIAIGNETGATALDFDAGTGGVAIDAQGAGTIAIGTQTDTGAINVGVGASARTITVGNGTGATGLVFNAGTGDITVGTNAIAHEVSIGNSTGDSGLTLASGTGGIDVDATGGALQLDSTSTIEIGVNAAAGNITIGSNATARELTLGNSTGTSGITATAGTGGIDIDCAGATGALALDTAGGDIEIGANAAAGDMNIGTNATARTITIGNVTGATGVVVDCGTGDLSLGASATAHEVTIGPASAATDAGLTLRANTGGIDIDCQQATGALALDTAGGAIEIGVNAAAGAINIGTNATAREVTVGNTTGASGLTLVAGTGGATLASDAAIELDTTAGGISLGAAGASDFTVSDAALTLAGTTIDMDATGGAANIDATTPVVIGGTNATGVNLGRSGKATTVKGTLNVDEAASFDSTVTIAGNLLVKGTQTSVSSSNLTIKDPIITLGMASGSLSGTPIPGPRGDRGFAFPQLGAWAGSPVLFWDDSGAASSGVPQGTFRMSYAVTSGSTDSITKAGALGLDVGAITTTGVTDSALTDNRVVIAGTSGVLEDSASLTFDGSDLQLANNIGLVFSTDDAEKIESNGSDLTLNSGVDINLTATTNVNVPSGVGVTFGADGEKISGNGTKLDIAAAELDFTIEAGGDINIGSDIGLTFGNDGEKIEGDGTNLTIASSGELDLTATGLIDINGSANLDVDITGTVDVLASSTFSIDGTGASNVTATSGNLTLSSATSGNVVVSSAAAVDVDADGGALSLDGSSGINIGTETDVAIDVDASTFDLDASGALTMTSTTMTFDPSSTLDLDAAGAVKIDGASVTVGGDGDTGAINMTAGATSKWVTDTGNLQIKNEGTAGGYANYLLLSGGFESSIVLQPGDKTDGSNSTSIDFMRGDGDATQGTASTFWSWNSSNLSVAAGGSFDENYDRGYTVISGSLRFKGNSTGNTALYAGRQGGNYNFLEVTASNGNLKLGADGALTTLASTATLVEGTAKLQFYDNGGTEFIQADASNNLTINAGDDITYNAAGADHKFQNNGTAQWAMYGGASAGFQMNGTADTGDYFYISCGANGVTQLSTTDDDGANATLDLKADGYLRFTPGSGNTNGDMMVLHTDGSTTWQMTPASSRIRHYFSGSTTLYTSTQVAAAGATTLSTGGSALAGGADYTLNIDGDINLNADDGLINFKDAGQLAMTVDMATTAGDAVFKDAGGTEIFRIDGSADALLMASTKKIEFNDETQFIHGSSATVLELGATDEIGLTATAVDMDANLDLDGTANISGLVTIQTGLVPDASDGAYLGTTALGWSDLFLASGAVINVANGNSTLTGGSALWTSNVAFQATRLRIDSSADYIDVSTDLQIVAAADVAINAGGGNVKPSADDGSALGVSATAWSDLFLASGGVINWNEADVTMTHSANTLAFAGATSGYTFANTLDLGGTNNRWANIYTGDLHLANSRGNYTIVEEEEMLTIRNNRNGKWYKLAMEEIDPTGRDEGMNGAPPLLDD